MKKAHLLIIPLIGLVLYAHGIGLNRGVSDYVPPGRESAPFYNFHPDEETLVRAAALLAVLLLALSPLAIQQAHFYTVDGVFSLLSLAMLLALVRALANGSVRAYAVAALLVGCAAAVRLNGLLLGGILVGAYAVVERREICLRTLVVPVLCGLLAVCALALLQPYLLADPSVLWQQRSHGDFAFSLGIAKGDVLQTWTLVDVHTVAYWHYLATLLPLAMGWPLALVALVALVYGGWQGSLEKRLLLAWCALYFLLVGGLHTKPIRYLYPLLPLLALFAADFSLRVFSRRLHGIVFSAALAFCTVLQGVVFAQIYSEEDARIQAARWLAKQAPAAATIGLEKGAFTLHKSIGGERTADLNILHLFYTGPYMLCAQRIDYLQKRAEQLDYIAVVAANRHRQFTAVPELYPVVADFSVAFDQWRRDISANADCGDKGLRRWAAALQQGDVSQARAYAERAADSPAPRPLENLLAAASYRRVHEPELARAAQVRHEYPSGQWAHLRKSPTAHRVPAATAATLVDLGLFELALAVLREGVGESVFYPFGALSDMADTYIAVAQHLLAEQEVEAMQEALELSIQLYEKPAAYNTLARVAYFSRDYAGAQRLWQRSLALDSTQEEIRVSLAELEK